MKFLRLALAIVVVVIAVSVMMASAAPGNGGESLDQETAELLDRYLKTRRMSPFGYMGGLPWGSVQQKRNSELINSILGLPKVMNDAGRK